MIFAVSLKCVYETLMRNVLTQIRVKFTTGNFTTFLQFYLSQKVIFNQTYICDHKVYNIYDQPYLQATLWTANNSYDQAH